MGEKQGKGSDKMRALCNELRFDHNLTTDEILLAMTDGLEYIAKDDETQEGNLMRSAAHNIRRLARTTANKR